MLRARAFQDDDVLVDLLGPTIGRVAVVARGARKHARRYGGALELGTRVDADITFRPGRDLQSFTRCEVTQPLRRIREDLDRITALAYLLELVRLSAREGAADERLHALAVSMVDVLEASAPTAEGILVWEVALLAHIGYGVTADGLADACGLAPTGRAALHGLWCGNPRVVLPVEALTPVRQGLERIWQRALGHAPRSARFLETGADADAMRAP
ncbi:DNA repair protein RecO [Myxococcota bacterium]|nr:DNA repair protein RecO [Myxococcota bacterium]